MEMSLEKRKISKFEVVFTNITMKAKLTRTGPYLSDADYLLGGI